MKKNVLVSVSTDPIQDYQSIVNYAKDMQGKADFLHCDVMDGVFVERKTISAQLVSNVNSNSSIMLDVHLMCDEPLKSIKEFARAGANIIWGQMSPEHIRSVSRERKVKQSPQSKN